MTTILPTGGVTAVAPTRLLPIVRMEQRAANGRDESDTTYFLDLMYFGEMLAKLAVAGIVAAVEDDKGRSRYRHIHALVRAVGIGDWANTLDEVLSSPTAQYLAREAAPAVRDLTQKVGEGTWQYEAVRQLHAALQLLEPDLQDAQGKTDGKRWVRLLARIRNKTRGHGAPPSALCSQLCPLLAPSIASFAAGFSLFEADWAYLHRNLSGKYRVTVLGGMGAPFEYLKRTTEESFPDGVYVFLGRPRLVELVDSDVDAHDVFFANGACNDRSYEALSYTTGSTKLLDAGPYHDPVGPLPQSETHGLANLDVVGSTFANLPDPPQGYIARSELEAEVLRALEGDRYPVVTLHGRGGIGKTSLALSVVHRLAQTKTFEAILWLSARDLDLLPEGPKRVQPAVVSLRDMANEVVGLLQPTEARAKGFKPEEYLATCLHGAPFGPTLYVFDNFETVVSPVELYRWLDTHIRLPSKILITTRQREFKGDYWIDVRGMTDTEFRQLVDQTAARLGVQHLLTDDYCDEVFRESEGHPYVAKILLGEVAKAGRLRDVERIVADSSQILAALFERTYAALTPAAQRVFLTLSSWRATLPRLAIEAVLLRARNERIPVDEAIDELQRSSFIEMATSDNDGQEFITTPLAACIFGKRKLAVSSLKPTIEADLALLREFGAGQREDVRHGLTPRLARLVHSIARRVSEGDQALDEQLQMLRFIAQHFRPAWLMLAKLQEESDSPTALTEACNSVRQFLADAKDDSEREQGWRWVAELCHRMGDAVGEVHSLAELSELPSVSLADISRAANRINQLLTEKPIALEGEERRMLIERVAVALGAHADAAFATDLSRLAWLEIRLGDERRAYEYVKRGLEREPGNEHCAKLAARLSERLG